MSSGRKVFVAIGVVGMLILAVAGGFGLHELLSDDGGGAPEPAEVIEISSEVEASNVTDNSAEITWSTTKKATSLVEYRKEGRSSWKQQDLDKKLSKDHSVELIGLDDETWYEYRVISADGDDEVESDIDTFKTKNLNGTSMEIFDVDVSDINGESAVITWSTDAEATSLVEYREKGRGRWISQDLGQTLETDNSVELNELDGEKL